ncbi:hypothetical protein AmyhaDRAFT_0282 [Haloechinothrix halophila YIM 93223]|uniref:Uncharacterized protein n=1 Tax=Haloechinothrix halophila YIM 93223 TaxID=592678 RepID=W9DNI3_9PSEU|nr:hypothetical protein AmyhaDRAFT_0282 [Haloechinothrix halophila YIM 93223]
MTLERVNLRHTWQPGRNYHDPEVVKKQQRIDSRQRAQHTRTAPVSGDHRTPLLGGGDAG